MTDVDEKPEPDALSATARLVLLAYLLGVVAVFAAVGLWL